MYTCHLYTVTVFLYFISRFVGCHGPIFRIIVAVEPDNDEHQNNNNNNANKDCNMVAVTITRTRNETFDCGIDGRSDVCGGGSGFRCGVCCGGGFHCGGGGG